jgi:hypothetical protein
MPTKYTMFFGMSRKRRISRGYLRSGPMHSFLRSWFMTSYYLGRYGSILMFSKGLTMPHLLCWFGKAVHSPCMDLRLASLLRNMISLARRRLRNSWAKLSLTPSQRIGWRQTSSLRGWTGRDMRGCIQRSKRIASIVTMCGRMNWMKRIS